MPRALFQKSMRDNTDGHSMAWRRRIVSKENVTSGHISDAVRRRCVGASLNTEGRRNTAKQIDMRPWGVRRSDCSIGCNFENVRSWLAPPRHATHAATFGVSHQRIKPVVAAGRCSSHPRRSQPAHGMKYRCCKTNVAQGRCDMHNARCVWLSQFPVKRQYGQLLRGLRRV